MWKDKHILYQTKHNPHQFLSGPSSLLISLSSHLTFQPRVGDTPYDHKFSPFGKFEVEVLQIRG